MRARAQRKEEVHRRITLAAVYLHGSIGPARTTVSDIAQRAGVRRATVYNHFPTDLDLIDACSSHWFGENPPPDPAVWAVISDPRQRVGTALEAMYEYYDGGREMLENVLRDTPHVPALEEILRQKWWPMLEGIVEVLARGWRSATEVETLDGVRSAGEGGEAEDPTPAGDQEIRAGLRVALDFFTWQTMADSGLMNKVAARLMAAWIEAVATPHQ